MKILELTNYSSGICGVWQRVRQESLELSKQGHEVMIFSSNATKGSDKIASSEDRIINIRIKRFPFKKLGGESFMFWGFKKQALKFRPDIIITHSYRHPHTIKALKIKNKLRKQGKNCKVFLVTHGPFIKNDSTRSFLAKLVVNFYDRFIAPTKFKKFDKIITVAKWEIPYLLSFGCKKEKISCIPNSIPEEFFKSKTKRGEWILFLGRIAEVKNLETLIKSIVFINKKVKLDIMGPAEKHYKNKLINLINSLKINKQINFLPPVYDLKEKIKIIDNHEFIILPSKYESFGFVLLEAMARKKLVISSKTQGGKEIIKDGINGFLFDIRNEKQLAKIMNKIQDLSEKEKNKIKKQARRFAEKFKCKNLIKLLENLF